MTAETASVVGDARFFGRAGPHEAARVADAVGGELRGPNRMLTGVAPLGSASGDHVSFLDNKRYIRVLEGSGAGAVILHPDLADRVPAGTAAIVSDNPYAGWAIAAALFHPSRPARPGVHASAVIEGSARVHPTATVGARCVVGEGVEIGPGCVLGAGAVVGDNVRMGADCRIGSLASISHAMLGCRVNVLPGARIGQEGFGFATTATGFVTVPQLGRVILEDDVEIGANTTIDRGALSDTVIGAGSRLDNLVMIGHGVRVGRCCVIVSQSGISGSTVLEDFVVIAAQAGLTGHLRIGSKARVGAQAGVMGDVDAGADVVGSPAEPMRDFFRGVATLRKLARRPKSVAAAAPDAGPATD